MKKHQLSFIITYFIIFFSSCKKETENNWEGSYELSEVVNVDPPRLYTMNGYITDSNTIKSFLHRDGLFFGGNIDSGFIFSSTTESNYLKIDVTLSENDTSYATVHYVYGTPRTFKFLSSLRSEEEIILFAQDTTYQSISSESSLRHAELRYFLDRSNTSTPVLYGSYGIPGYPSIAWFKTKNNLTLLKSNNKIIMPLIRTYIKTGGCCQSTWQNTWSYLNTNISERLVFGDTIVLQTKTVELKRN